jgi:hypothetical protein
VKHNIDVGRTASVILFTVILYELLSGVGIALGGNGNFNMMVILLYLVARGMWNHNNIARLFLLVLIYLSIVFSSSLLLLPYISSNPPSMMFVNIGNSTGVEINSWSQ